MNNNNIIHTDVVNELENSFLEYSMSVIISRALPDVRDGLKPVHRRILYSLYEQGIRYNTPHKKSARVVGDVMGKYHPHGDSSIYEALVRMAQPWSMSKILIDGHGNFGSLDDGPAAMRYTECRLSNLAMYILDEINENTVDFTNNYDQTEIEPESLPSAFPNLLVNGSTGIAVGMATNMPPHNFDEINNAVIYLLKEPKATLEDILKIIKGPDLPTGGTIIYDENLINAYKTGRGSFKIRSKFNFETAGKRDIINITELPFLVGPEKIISKIKELVNNKKIEGIYDIKDLSDRKTGLRLSIYIKNGFKKENVLKELFSLTQLEDTFSVNNVALVRGEPKTLSLLDMLELFINYRVETIKRRSLFRLDKATSRLHILEGLLLALSDIENVILIIKSSKDSNEAKNKLIKKLSLSDTQATAILDMTLRRLTSLEVGKIKEESNKLIITITELKKLLSSDINIKNNIKEEITHLNNIFPTNRKTEIINFNVKDNNISNKIEDNSEVIISINKDLYILKNKLSGENNTYKKFSYFLKIKNKSIIYFISNYGKVYQKKVDEIDYTVKNKPVELNKYITLDKGEKIIGMLDGASDALLITKKGMTKKINKDNYVKRNGTVVMKLKDDDNLVNASIIFNNSEFFIIGTSKGIILKFNHNTIPYQMNNSYGVKGIKLSDEDFVITGSNKKGNYIMLLSNLNKYLFIDISIPIKSRASKGVRCYKTLPSEKIYSLEILPGTFEFYNYKNKKIKLNPKLTKRDHKGLDLPNKISFIVT